MQIQLCLSSPTSFPPTCVDWSHTGIALCVWVCDRHNLLFTSLILSSMSMQTQNQPQNIHFHVRIQKNWTDLFYFYTLGCKGMEWTMLLKKKNCVIDEHVLLVIVYFIIYLVIFYVTFLVICFLWVMNVRMVDWKLLTLCVSMYEIIMYRLWCNYMLLQKRSTFRHGTKWSLRHTGYCPAKCCCK